MLCACRMAYVLYCIMLGMCDAGSVLYHIVLCIYSAAHLLCCVCIMLRMYCAVLCGALRDSFQLLHRATPDTTKTNRMPVSSSTILHRFDTLQQCDRRVTNFTEESFVLTIVTQLPPTGTILSRSQLLKEEIATRFKDYLSTSLQFICLLIVSVPVIL